MLVKCPVCGARILNGRCEYCGFIEDSTPQAQPPSQYPTQGYLQSPTSNTNLPYQQPYLPSQPSGHSPQSYPQSQPAIQPHVVIVNQNQATTDANFSNNISNTVLPNFHAAVSRKSKIAALILCVLLGPFGAHKFYVGKHGAGVLYLFTFGLFGIGWIVDMISILEGEFRDEFDLPLRG